LSPPLRAGGFRGKSLGYGAVTAEQLPSQTSPSPPELPTKIPDGY